MEIETLIEDYNYQHTKPDLHKSRKEIELAKRDFRCAERDLRNGYPEWALVIAYHSMLHATRAVLSVGGFKGCAPYALKTAADFLKEMERQAERIRRARPGQ
ncbi:HEPN domain-containing protein [Candidatus Micrarchaeota archaeon]|nr:HEPN domain-containing protein [Candidatus Micrarchaeota archaeon]